MISSGEFTEARWTRTTLSAGAWCCRIKEQWKPWREENADVRLPESRCQAVSRASDPPSYAHLHGAYSMKSSSLRSIVGSIVLVLVAGCSEEAPPLAAGPPYTGPVDTQVV